MTAVSPVAAVSPVNERKKVRKVNAQNLTSLSVRDAEVEMYRQRPALMDFSVNPELTLKNGSSHSVN